MTIDANVLLYASDTSSPEHERANELLHRLGRGPDLLHVFWPTIMAYLRIATHPSIFEHPLTPQVATANIDRLLQLPHVRSPGEVLAFWPCYRAATEGVVVRGNLVPDAHIAGLMRCFGVSTIWTRDRDFRKFTGITVRDPFASS